MGLPVVAAGSGNIYDCTAIQALPFKGTEILLMACVFLFIAVCFTVAFLDVAVKQLWPSLLDPAVTARIAGIQRLFPNLGAARDSAASDAAASSSGAQEKDQPKQPQHTIPHPVTGEPIHYDSCVASESYICTRAVDDDLLHMQLSNSAFHSVSSYCSSTMRGYMALSTMLCATSICLSFLNTHNAVVDPFARGGSASLALLGYVLCMITSIVMMTPSTDVVQRNANQMLWFSVPLSKGKWINSTHMFGLGCGLIFPMVAHVKTALDAGPLLFPNYYSCLLSAAALAILMVLYGAIQKGVTGSGGSIPGLTSLTADKISILLETMMVFCAFLGDLQYEAYAPASCISADGADYFNKILLVAMFAPFVFIAVKQLFAPSKFVQPPSLVLTYKGVPCATYGPVPVIDYNNEPGAELPHVELQ